MRQIFEQQDIRQFTALLDRSTRIVMTCHVHPDGDAIGSTLGLWHLLRKLGKDATVVVPDMPPKSLRFLPGFNEIAVYTRHDSFCERVIADAELIICCDFNKFSRLDHLGPVMESANAQKILIDHHQEPGIDCVLQFSYPAMSSTCELVFRLIAAAGLYTELDKDGATCLLTGLITDTQNFTVNCHDPEIYEVLMRLMEKGVDKTRIINEAVKATSYDSLRLRAFALSERLDILLSHRVAITTLSREDLDKFHYEKGDTEGLVNEPLNIRGMVASYFLREDPDCVKISARSRYDYPVSDVCKELCDGGGHRQAAGGEFKGPLQECKAKLISILGKYDRYIPSKIDKIDIK